MTLDKFIGSTDPVRYTADMLAWIHQSIPNERENFLLLQSCDQVGKFLALNNFHAFKLPIIFLINLSLIISDLNERMSTCSASIIDDVCQPFNVRME